MLAINSTVADTCAIRSHAKRGDAMKNPWEWEEADVQSLITNSVQESLTMEYKICDALQKTDGKKKEISKDVSAMANSAGGTIVYGVCEDKHVPTAIDTGFDPSNIPKEWIEQVINSNIERRIDGIRIREIPLSGPKASKVIYAVSIPESRRAPHMASDNRYYKRFNFESVPMEDYEVRDVGRRLETPDLLIGFRVNELKDYKSGLGPNFRTLDVEIFVGNNSPAAAEYALLTWCKDVRLLSQNPKPDNKIRFGKNEYDVVFTQMEWRGQLRLPIWQAMRYQLDSMTISLPPSGGPFYFFWEAHAPKMERKTGAYLFHNHGGMLYFHDVDCDWRFENEIYRKV